MQSERLQNTKRIESVIFLTYHFPPEVGGIQTRISKYVENLAKRGIRVKVLVVGRNPIVTARFQGSEVVPCSGGVTHFPRNAFLVTKSVIRSKADVVHVFTGASTLLGVYALTLGRAMRARCVVSFFGREDFVFPNLASGVLFRLSTNLAGSIDVNSSATGTSIPKKFKIKTHVLLGAAEEPRSSALAQAQSHQGEAAVLLFVGRLVERKGVDDLLRAFAIIRPRFPQARLSIVGDGPERNTLVKLAEQLQLSDSVDFRGTRVEAELDQEYARCTALVLPSKDVATDMANEGLGLALIEASMHAKPLIGTRHGGILEIVKQDENGILVPPGDPASLAEAMAEILTNEDQAREMGKRGFQMAKSRFSWERATNVLLETYA
jgi:glycosyltransferase involved in cell wall biosynthesis